MDSILEFKQAAKNFQSDERYLAFVAARKANDEDKDLQDKLGEFNLVRLDLNNELSKEGRSEERISELNTRINTLYSDIMTNEHMLAYNRAKEDMESFMEWVNAIMNAAIDGEDPLMVEEPTAGGCGGEGCASCAGCG